MARETRENATEETKAIPEVSKKPETVTISVADLENLVKNKVEQALAERVSDQDIRPTVDNMLPPDVVENEKRMQELVPVKLFKDKNKYKDDVIVSVNGKIYQIQRGVEVKVPRFVKEVIDNGLEQDTRAAEAVEELSKIVEYTAEVN